MSFDDFLDMFSVFSEAAPRDIKAVYAFKIYGKKPIIILEFDYYSWLALFLQSDLEYLVLIICAILVLSRSIPL